MELHERLSHANGDTRVWNETADPFAEVKNRIHLAIVSELGPRLFEVDGGSASGRERVVSEIRAQLQQEPGLSREDREQIASEIADDIFGYGPLERLLPDQTISEIMVNGPHEIWIERRGLLSLTPLRFSDESHLRRIITKMVGQIGRRIDESSPMVEARLPDGSRVHAIVPPLSLTGPLLTIRKFAQNRYAMDELVEIGTLSPAAADFMARCVQADLNMLISGGTGTGKTTLLNALSAAVPGGERHPQVGVDVTQRAGVGVLHDLHPGVHHDGGIGGGRRRSEQRRRHAGQQGADSHTAHLGSIRSGAG